MTDIEFLIDKLRKGIVSFTYRKKNGGERHAIGTLYGVEHTIKGTARSQCSWVLKYFDLECHAWRCFIIDNLVSIGEVRQSTIEEHHDICLALVARLKERMLNEESVASAYRKTDGTIRYAHGCLSHIAEKDEKYFTYFDIDKGEERKFRIDAFIGFGEEGEIDTNHVIYERTRYHESAESDHSYSNFSKNDIRSILSKNGVRLEDVEDCLVVDLIPYLDKSQLKDLIIRATTRLAEL